MIEKLGGQATSPKAVTEALAKEGVQASAGLVGFIKHD
jgi:hypothetical protein